MQEDRVHSAPEEQALFETEVRTRAILGAPPDAIATIDEHGGIESINPATERLFGEPVRLGSPQ